MCVTSGFHFCLKEKSHMGKLDNIFCTGLNLYGSGRIEESLRMLEMSSEEWEVVRNYLPVFYILAWIYFWENSGFKIGILIKSPRNFYSQEMKLLQELKGTLNSSILIMLLRYFIADVPGNCFLANNTKQLSWQDNVENKQQGHCIKNKILFRICDSDSDENSVLVVVSFCLTDDSWSHKCWRATTQSKPRIKKYKNEVMR